MISLDPISTTYKSGKFSTGIDTVFLVVFEWLSGSSGRKMCPEACIKLHEYQSMAVQETKKNCPFGGVVLFVRPQSIWSDLIVEKNGNFGGAALSCL